MKKIGLATFFHALRQKLTALGAILTWFFLAIHSPLINIRATARPLGLYAPDRRV
jgi:hypothetical protein